MKSYFIDLILIDFTRITIISDRIIIFQPNIITVGSLYNEF